MKNKSKWLTQIWISLFLSLLVIVLTLEIFFTIVPLKEFEQNHIDERFLRRGPIDIRDKSEVIILEITQETYDGLPHPYNIWPWPRIIFSKIIENLNEAGAKVIGIDLIMSNQDRLSPLNDSSLVAAIKKYKNVIVAGKVEDATATTIQTGEDGETVYKEKFLIRKTDFDYNNIFFRADSGIGLVNVTSDHDGVFRRYLPFIYSPTSERLVPTFGFAVLNKYFALPNNHLALNEKNYFVLQEISIPKFDDISLLINFYGPSRTFRHENLLNVLDDSDFNTHDEIFYGTEINTWEDSAYQSLFKDKIVLIGSTMPEDKDILPIAFAKGEKKGDNLIYGVEFHANAIQNIISKDFLVKESMRTELLLIFLLTFLSFFSTSYFKNLKSKYGLLIEMLNLSMMIGLIFVIREFSFFLFQEKNYVIALVSPSLSIILGYFGSTAYNFIGEKRQKAVIKGMFSHYVNPTIVDELVTNPEKLKLGGENKFLTVFFSDIVGFSTFSEKKSPEDLVKFLNEYLSSMTNLVFINKGTLDKYIGDAVMAFWGAPIPIENHAYLACSTALQMQAELVKLRKKWETEGETLIEVRMGINTGNMVVGNVGGKERFDYTVMGDNVNLASRLEGANKEYGTLIMISESTYDEIKEHFLCRELDLIIVKGKSKPIKVYELISYIEQPQSENMLESLNEYNLGLDCYKNRNFLGALKYFSSSLILNPSDAPSKVYLERCELFLDSPPAENWDGVFTLTRK
ncbi:MAG: hypothetical protein C0425_09960 [Chlorobiaceae bacterium]|nr:hypothetical protein [Chlorobiaceae bacterium]MBA4310643.1 hypothetical protein [Chlorobiaceae bacterium]